MQPAQCTWQAHEKTVVGTLLPIVLLTLTSCCYPEYLYADLLAAETMSLPA